MRSGVLQHMFIHQQPPRKAHKQHWREEGENKAQRWAGTGSAVMEAALGQLIHISRQAGKTKGHSKLSELPAEILDPTAGKRREGAWARTRHCQSRVSRASESSSGAHGDESGENCSICSRNRTATVWEALIAHSLLPSIHLASVFCQKNKWSSWLKRAMFPNVHTCGLGSGCPFSYCIFLIINGGIVICLLIQTGQI